MVDGLITTNRRGRIQSYNKACARLFGYTAEEALGKNVSMLMPELHRSRHDNYIGDYLSTGSSSIIGIGRDVFGQRKDGSIFPMRISIGEDVSSRSFIALIHDLTEERRAHEQLLANEEQLQLLIDAAPAAIAMFDSEMRYLAYSQRYVTDYGLADQSLAGLSHYEVFPEIPERWKEAHRRCMAGAVERCEEDAFLRVDGKTASIRWEIRPWRGPRRESAASSNSVKISLNENAPNNFLPKLNGNCATPNRWRHSVSSPEVWRMTSTICWASSSAEWNVSRMRRAAIHRRPSWSTKSWEPLKAART